VVAGCEYCPTTSFSGIKPANGHRHVGYYHFDRLDGVVGSIGFENNVLLQNVPGTNYFREQKNQYAILGPEFG
jgi:hypothetical protein